MGVTLTSAVRAAVLILGREILRSVEVEVLPDGAAETCRIIGASRSQAYEMLARLKGVLEDLQGHPGRPPRESTQAVDRDLLVAVRDFLMQHPGCVEGRGSRRVYHVKYRDFVLRQLSPGGAAHALTQEQAVDVFGVPLGTIKDWMAGPGSTPPGSMEAPADGALGEGEGEIPTSGVESADPFVALILREFPRWKGSFGGFCRFLKREWRVPYGRTLVASILEAAGLRRPNRQGRERRPWSEDTFRQLFPGAQWIGDGKTVIIEWLGQPMVFNFEALVDVATNAVVGVEVSDTEDEQAVLAAHAHAQATTSGDPIAVTLDQRPSNHTDAVREAVAPAQLLASTKARPTAKAPMEGCFGLFSQMAPPLVVSGATPREQAKSALKAEPLVDFRFWVERFRETLAALSPWMRRTLHRWMTQHISRAYKTPRDRRRELIATLSATATVATG